MDVRRTGKLIANKRKQKNLTQSELARKIDISDKAISKWERGLSFPDITRLITLTEVLEISLYELLKGEEKDGK